MCCSRVGSSKSNRPSQVKLEACMVSLVMFFFSFFFCSGCGHCRLKGTRCFAVCVEVGASTSSLVPPVKTSASRGKASLFELISRWVLWLSSVGHQLAAGSGFCPLCILLLDIFRLYFRSVSRVFVSAGVVEPCDEVSQMHEQLCAPVIGNERRSVFVAGQYPVGFCCFSVRHRWSLFSIRRLRR